MSAILVQHLSKSFGDALILDDISFTVEEGEFVCIIGPSGCGKSTLLRIIQGLEESDSGSVHVCGSLISSAGSHCASVFQSDALMPWRTVYQNVKIGLEMGAGRGRPLSSIDDALSVVGLSNFANYYPRQLSGGMKQRVNLARALAVDPDVLLMDEPFAALDAQTREIMQTQLLQIWSEQRKAVLFITHQLDEALYLADRVLIMGRHPGTFVDEFDVPFERPRHRDLKQEEIFNKYVGRAWRVIEEVITSTGGV